MRALLISTYDLGRQPFGLASPAAWLRREGIDVRCADASKEPIADPSIREADFIAFHLPMHTATRLAGPLVRRVRALNPGARLAAYGLYAPLNEAWLRSIGIDHILGAEFEAELTAVASSTPNDPSEGRPAANPPPLPRLQFLVPDRSGLPPLARYATLRLSDGTRVTCGYTEASRGCRHLCRHCPVVPVYSGQFRVVQADVVLADIAGQVAAGAQHITFGDPDFFNGPTHATRIVEAMHAAHPGVTYDVTIKIEHLLGQRRLLPLLRETGCLFVTSAVESLDDRVLARLDKGHTRADFLEAERLCRSAGLTLVPTFVPFHPWTTAETYCDLLDTIAQLDLIDHVAPIQLAIRLLIPQGSRLLELEEVRALAGGFDPKTLTYRWTFGDAAVERLYESVNAIVGSRPAADRREVFGAIDIAAHRAAGRPAPPVRPRGEPRQVPYMSEPWYCCAEPSPDDLRLL